MTAMDTNTLLRKFDAVEITNDNRITDEELLFCRAQQTLYAKVLAQHCYAFDVLQQLNNECAAFIRSVADDNEFETNDYSHSRYSCEYAEISKEDFIKNRIVVTHERFISVIMGYFTERYNISMNEPEYETLLGLKEPAKPEYAFRVYRDASDEERAAYEEQERGYREAMDDYRNSLINSELDYNAMLDHIFIELGGSTFVERADQEIKEGSRKAVSWRRGKPEIKNKRVVLGILYPKKNWNGEYVVDLSDEHYRAVLRALAYFDSMKQAKEIYPGWQEYVAYGKREYEGIFESHEVHGTKVLAFKYYKNGKFEITFDSHAHARQFTEDYLSSEGGDGDD